MGKATSQQVVDLLLDKKNPSRSNQAVMELGAVICLPRDPHCDACPVSAHCQAFKLGTQKDHPAKRVKPATVHLQRDLLVIRRKGDILLAPSSRVQGFWDLPEPFAGARIGGTLGEFRHSITHRSYRFVVHEAVANSSAPEGLIRWFGCKDIDEIPLSTTAKKGLRCSIDI